MLLRSVLTGALLVLLPTAGATAATYVVNKVEDDDGPCTPADCALREAILAANAGHSEQDVILLPGGTYRLSLTGPGEDDGRTGDLDIRNDLLEIRGDPDSPALIVGDGSDRVFDVRSAGDVRLVGLEVTGGNVEGGGGGIQFAGALGALERVDLHHNVASGYGGGLLVADAEVEVIASSIHDNWSEQFGGAIAGLGGVGPLDRVYLRIRNTTLSDNGAVVGGGGIFLNSETSLVVSHCTVTGNAAPRGSVLFASSRILTRFRNSLLVGDCALDHQDRHVNTNGGNVESPADTCFSHDVGDAVDVADPGLGPLADNGGPTPTHALLPGSPAIDRGIDADCATRDQRGFWRPADGDGDGVRRCDAGAFELDAPRNAIEIPVLSSRAIAALVALLALAGAARLALPR